MLERKKESPKPILVGVLIAFIIHAVIILSALLPTIYNFWNGLFPQAKPKKSTEVTMLSLSKREWDKNRKVQPQIKSRQKKRTQKEEPKKKEKLKGQVIDIAPTADNSVPKNSRYLSEHNTNVEKESVSRHQRKNYQVAQPSPTIASPQARRADKPQPKDAKDKISMLTKKRGSKHAKSTKKSKTFTLEMPDIKKRQALKLKLDMSSGTLNSQENAEEVMGNSDKMRLRLGFRTSEDDIKGDQGKDDRTLALFRPSSLEKLDMVTGAPSNDHIRDVPKGEQTMLNSREFRYATFFNRVKRGVSNHWSPLELYLQHDPYGNVYGVKDRHTVVNIVLDNQGSLEDISVVQSSGVGFLDEEAVSAIQGAAPFPNPPQGLVEQDGRIRFHFGFTFMIGERPRFRTFKPQRFR